MISDPPEFAIQTPPAGYPVDDVTRSLPHAIGPEKSVLSAMMQYPDTMVGMALELGLTEGHFYLPSHATLFRVLLELSESGKEIELISFVQKLLDIGQLDRVGGPSAEKNTPQQREDFTPCLAKQAQMCGCATPRAEDAESCGMRHSRGVADTLSAQAGQDLKSSTAGTGKPVALNPDHSRWLMGFPVEWGCCGATVMQSSRKSRRNSSPPISI